MIFPRLSTHLGLRDPVRPQLSPDADDQSAAARVRRAQEAGFGAVFDNFLMARGKDYRLALADAVREHDMAITSFVHAPDLWDTPGWIDGSALTDLAGSLDAARRCNIRHIMCVTAQGDDGFEIAARKFADNLQRAGDLAGTADVTLCIEATHPAFAPGLMLERIEQALEILALADHPHVGIAMDVGHVAMHGADPAAAIRLADRAIAQVQVADVPGRVEPGAGTMDWMSILSALTDIGYDGFLELEFEPAGGRDEMLTNLEVLGEWR